jgi:hypothetical protein
VKSIKKLFPNIRSKDGITLLCVGESFLALQIIFGFTPLLAGLLLIIFSRRLSGGTAALLSKMTDGRSLERTAAIRTFYIIFGALLMFAGVNGFLLFIVGCKPVINEF